jgi:hypothetical protein
MAHQANVAGQTLARKGVLHWVPGRGYHVRARFTMPVSDRGREDGRLTAVPTGRDL